MSDDDLEPSAEQVEQDALVLDAEMTVRDAYLAVEAEPKIFPALPDPEAEL